MIDPDQPEPEIGKLFRGMSPYQLPKLLKQAGYVEEMEGIEAALNDGDRERGALYDDAWLSNATSMALVMKCRGVEEWFDQGAVGRFWFLPA